MAICRRQEHPRSDERHYSAIVDGRRVPRRQCLGCERSRQACRRAARRADHDELLPTIDRERQQWYAAWSAGITSAIARLRDDAGFDGRTREWRTLGDIESVNERRTGA